MPSDTASQQDALADTAAAPDTGPPTACSDDDDCAHVLGCCYTGACSNGACLARGLPDCCSVPGPCAVYTTLHAATCEAECVAGGCVHTLRLPTDGCTPEPLWTLDLAHATPADWTVLDPREDRVTWHLTTRRGLAAGPSLHAGDVLCPTYHTGPLDASCRPIAPAADADAVSLTLDLAPVPLPIDRPSVAVLWVWLDVEVSGGRAPGAVYDGLEVGVVDDAGILWPRWSSRASPPPPRSWTPVVIDLSELAGRIVRVRLAFDTLDGRDNDHEGVYLGGLSVLTPCAADRGCAADAPCALGRVLPITPTVDTLCVTAPRDPGAVCTPCVVATTCAVTDPCDVPRCDDGVCAVTRELTASCCTPDHAFPAPASFEAPLGDGWTISSDTDATEGRAGAAGTAGAAAGDEAPDAAPARWHVSDRRAHDGAYALRFGVPEGVETAPPGVEAAGEVWSPPLVVPVDAPTWTFAVWLSTEFDEAPDPVNPAGLDLLAALVQVETAAPVPLAAAVMWDSRALGGTTAGAWVTVAVDLRPFAGATVRLGWRFATGDAEANDHEGAYVDDPTVFRACPAGDPPASPPLGP